MPFGGLFGTEEYKVLEVKTLGKANDAQAKTMLQRIAHQVQPIMHKRKWVCPILSEFIPRNPALRGINYGGGSGRTQHIKLQIRRVGRENEFYEYEDMLLVMLHELCHNVRGPHDATFYKLLDEITKECEELMAKGIGGTGAGFDAAPAGRSGAKGFGGHNPDAGSLRKHALKAAEERSKKGSLMPQGGRKLGGSSIFRIFSASEAAGQAAIRREDDNVWCPCETNAKELHKPHPKLPDAEPAEAPATAESVGEPQVCDLTMLDSDGDDNEGMGETQTAASPSPPRRKRAWWQTRGIASSPDSSTGEAPSAPAKRRLTDDGAHPRHPSLTLDDDDDIQMDIVDHDDIDTFRKVSHPPLAAGSTHPGSGKGKRRALWDPQPAPFKLAKDDNDDDDDGGVVFVRGTVGTGKRESTGYAPWPETPEWPTAVWDVGSCSGLTMEEKHEALPWTCKQCTLRNAAFTSVCAACEAVCSICAAKAKREEAEWKRGSAAREEAKQKLPSLSPPPQGSNQSTLSRLWSMRPGKIAGDIVLSAAPRMTDAVRGEKPAGNPFVRRPQQQQSPYWAPGTAPSHGARLLAATQATAGARDSPDAAPALGNTRRPSGNGVNPASFYGPPRATPPSGLKTYSRKQTANTENAAPAERWGAGTSASGAGTQNRPDSLQGRVSITRVGEAVGLGGRGPFGWTCKTCTLLNDMSRSTCSACDSWRYSTRPPAMSRPTIGGM